MDVLFLLQKRHYNTVVLFIKLFFRTLPSAVFDILTWKASHRTGRTHKVVHLLMDIGHVQFFKSLNAVSFGERKQTVYSGRTRMTLTDDVDHHTEA